MATPTTIDDHDPEVQYVGTWVSGGTSHEVDGTVSSSTTVGDSFTLHFTGAQIGVYGTIDSTSGGVITSYALDGGTAAQATSPAGSGDTYRQQFWTSPTLTPGDHTLVVTMVKVNPNSEFNEGTIWFDYFLVTPDPATSTIASTPAASPTSASTPAPVTVSVTVLVTPSSSSASSATGTIGSEPADQSVGASGGIAQDNLRNHAGAIAGGVVGGVVFLALVLLIAMLLRRRAVKKQRDLAQKGTYRATIEDGAY